MPAMNRFRAIVGLLAAPLLGFNVQVVAGEPSPSITAEVVRLEASPTSAPTLRAVIRFWNTTPDRVSFRRYTLFWPRCSGGDSSVASAKIKIDRQYLSKGGEMERLATIDCVYSETPQEDFLRRMRVDVEPCTLLGCLW